MKLFHIIVLLFAAVLIAQSDPYGIAELDQDKKKKKSKVQTVDTLITNSQGSGEPLIVHVNKGKKHNHPLFAIWMEDLDGNYIQTLYVARSIANSIFNYGDKSEGSWSEGIVRRPAALPYWSHKRGVQAEDGLYMPSPDKPVADAYSGATSKNNWVLETRADDRQTQAYYILLEVNQPWDWNRYWTNNKYPDNEEYKTSAQPAVVYRVKVDPKAKDQSYTMKVIGHSHYAGEDGSLNEDISTLSTSLEILKSITVTIPAPQK